MGPAKIIYVLFFLLHIALSRCDVHSLSCNILCSEGLGLPRYTESVTVNDVTFYDSTMKSSPPYPEWVNTPAAQQHWDAIISLSHHNRAKMGSALQTAISEFNLTAPQVRILERQRAGSTILTCHVIWFYPRAVQVKWIGMENGKDFQLIDDEMNDVLPNGDDAYQTRRSVIIPEEKTGDQLYSCVVHHSSIREGNITVTWATGKQHDYSRGRPQ